MLKTLISPVSIGGFVEKDRALLYMPHIGLKVKERGVTQKRTSLTWVVASLAWVVISLE